SSMFDQGLVQVIRALGLVLVAKVTRLPDGLEDKYFLYLHLQF
ncbi:13816_t:CDS:1, partial [Cetraspora pellucida]